jgi:hypothetical protein
MENDFNLDFDLEDLKTFKISPELWLRTLLAIAGDKEMKQEAVQKIAQKTGFSPAKVEMIMTSTIGVLISQTRAN